MGELFEMKLSNLAIMFVFIIACILFPRKIMEENIQAIEKQQLQYNQAIDIAVDDAIYDLVEFDSGNEIKLDKEQAVSNFFKTLCLNLGANSKEKQELLKAYVPVILVTDTDGYYIYYSDLISTSNGKEICQNWTEKLPYSYEEKGDVYSFTLKNFVKVYDHKKGKILEGTYSDMKKLLPNSTIFQNEKQFDTIRRQCIIRTLKNTMSYYVNEHNRIAKHYNIMYEFSFPEIENEDWYRTIDDVSFLAVFQGYPYGGVHQGYYNRYAFGGARVKKENYYYLTQKGNEFLYHKGTCKEVNEFSVPYFSKVDCAKQGAYPCSECNP